MLLQLSHFFPFSPSPPSTPPPLPQAFPTPLFMSMDHAYSSLAAPFWSQRDRKWAWEGEKQQCERETNHLPPLYTPNQRSSLQPRYVPWLGIGLVTLRCTGCLSNQLSHLTRTHLTLFFFGPGLQDGKDRPEWEAAHPALSAPHEQPWNVCRQDFLETCPK